MSATVTTALIIVLACVIPVTLEGNSSYAKLYLAAVEAYRGGRWFECFNRVQQAISQHHEHQDLLIQCRLLCQRAGSLPDVETLSSIGYIVAVNSAECSKRCLREGGDVEGPRGDTGAVEGPAEEDLELEFQQLLPYDYLQYCAYHSGQIPAALSAAYTFSLAYPNHEYMGKNLQLYRNHPEASDTFLVNLEEQKHQTEFEIAAKYYGSADYERTIVHMEEATKLYYLAHERCSTLCDKPVDDTSLKSIGQSDTRRIRTALFDHWIAVLQCKINCPIKLATIRGTHLQNFDVELYNYLQFCYYKMDQLKAAAQCASSYLMFKPDSEAMQKNKDIYISQPQVTLMDFEPRQDAKQYYNRKERELGMLEELMKKRAELDENTRHTQEAAEANVKRSLEGFQVARYPKDNEQFTVPIEDYMTSHGLVVSMETETLLGNKRVVVDGILGKQLCRDLVDIYRAVSADSNSAATRANADGASNIGITMDAAAALAREGRLDATLVNEYIAAVETSRAAIEKYFQVESALLFQHARLLCSSAADNDPDDIGTVGLLEVESEEDFLALLYLTDDFKGGELAFTYSNYTLQKVVLPLIGRLVAMGGANQHGMMNIQSGERCVVAMTFTCNPANQLPEYARAVSTLRRIGAPDWVSHSAELSRFMDKNGYKVVLTETDLNGPERFTADHMTTYTQCQALIALADRMAVMGDGYQNARSRSSPHTDHEKFVGLTVRRAAEMAAAYKVSAEAVELYVGMSEQALEFTRLYFNLEELYFAYIHLVCRTSLDDEVLRHDLSHPIHTDNSIMQPDGTTKRIRPAYIERDYSAIVYLNGDFKGGDFFFAHQNFSVQSALHPHCGMLASFNAGNYHGVRAVESGQRCAIALWFTRDKRYADKSVVFARDILTQLSNTAFGPNQNPQHIEL